jgi:outer membrane immunogenic protein
LASRLLGDRMSAQMNARRTALGLFALATAAGFGSGVAHAQYAPPPQPPPFVYMWNGGYVGLNAGVAKGADATSEAGTSNFFGLFDITTSGSGTMTGSGFTGGGVVGYNWQIGGWVLGAEADISHVGLSGTQDASAVDFTSITEHDHFATSWLSTVRGRLGYAWGGWLFYVTGGAAIGDHHYDGTVQMFGIASNPSGDAIKVGWATGVGTEWMFAPGWTTKIEYLHADLGSATFSASMFGNQVSVTGHLTEDILRLGLNYKLGW